MATFVISDRIAIDNGQTEDVFVDNPADSDFDLYIILTQFNGNEVGEVDIHRNVTQDTSGTTIPPRNVRGGDTTAQFTSEAGGTYSGLSDPAYLETLITGQAPASVGQIGMNDPVAVVKPGENLLSRITNTGGSNGVPYSTVLHIKQANTL